MKELMKIMMLIAIFAVASCTGKKGGDAETADSTAVDTETTYVDDAATGTDTDASADATIDASDADVSTDGADDAAEDGDANSGQTYTAADGMVIYNFAEVAPSFTYKKASGQKAIGKYLSAKLNYPSKAKNDGVEGKVMMQFVVTSDGSVRDVEVAKGSGNDDLDAEALRVVSGMPNWVAGQQGGENVAVKYTQPITFKLQ